ncbi:hypothetical protein [Proteiniphilum acetatigenes]|nr:hypothetical protein [Proteiniphilum acetatigenes]
MRLILPKGNYQLVLITQFTGTKTLLKEPRLIYIRISSYRIRTFKKSDN